MLKVYGPARSRASRVLWMLEECGVTYEHEDLSRHATMEEKAAAMRAVYPLGKVPFLEDGDLRMGESMAINLHLARKYGKSLWPTSADDQSRALQWSFFAATEIDPPLIQLMIERTFRKEPERNAENEKKNAELITRPLRYLDQTLAGTPHLLGNSFTVADLNTASILTMTTGAKLDLAEYPAIKAWSERCYSRPAYRAVTASKAGVK